MYCTKCGIQLKSDDDRFCSQCGTRTPAGRVEFTARTLLLDKRNKKIGGICAGFARYLEVDVNLVRVVWLAVAVTTGVGFVAYIAAWLIMPSDHGLDARAVGFPAQQAG